MPGCIDRQERRRTFWFRRLDFAAAGEVLATALEGVPKPLSLTLVSVGCPLAREISSGSLVMGSEDEELSLSLLEGLEPRERAGLVEEEGARVVVLLFICPLFWPAELEVCFPAVDVVFRVPLARLGSA